MFENVPLLRELSTKLFSENSFTWISLTDILQFLRKHHNITDHIKEIKRFNILKEFKGHKFGVLEKESEPYINVTSFLRYFFNHCDQLQICSEIVLQIQSKLTQKRDEFCVQNTQDLYKIIASKNFTYSKLQDVVYNEISIDEDKISSLHKQYKHDFTKDEWIKICFFENHVLLEYEEAEYAKFEEQLAAKYNFLQNIDTVKEITKSISRTSKRTIKSRQKRQNTASENEEIQLYSEKVHIIKKVEFELTDLFENEIEKVVVSNCINKCKHEFSCHVFAELKNEHCLNTEELIQTIQLHLNRKHDLKCGLILLLQPGTFASFLTDNGKIARFKFLEEFQQTGLPESIIFAYRLPDLATKPDIDIPENIPQCEECYISDNKPSVPLHWKNFNLLQEWSLDVPLSVQILLESFVNQKSLDRSSELENFVKTKLLKLYSIYDTLLNLTNRNYCGVLQDLNTQELAMNYQSVGTVFSISSSSGVTLSLNSAEKKLKEKAADDICNYNTYIRRYPMKYQTLAGMRNNLVSLQECLIVVMMDNLVRLKYHSDPNPGENRSMQLCTLPITIKGVPINSLEIEEKWHDQIICDQSNCCPCKIDQILTKEDFNYRILSLLPEEENCLTRFRNMMTWTLFDVWKKIAEDDDDFLQLGGLERKVCENDTLERSFAALDILEKDMGDIEIQEELVKATDSEGSDCSSSENYANKTIDYEVCLSEDENSEEASTAEEIDIEEEIYLQNIFEDVEIKITSDTELDNLESYFKPLDQSTDATIQESVESENEDENVQSTDEVVTSQSSTIDHDLVAGRFGFRQHQSPPMLTRHPPPATGRDDDLQKLREVLDDIMSKVNSNDAAQGGLKILFAPDNKIGSNLLKLLSSSKKYQIFLPEFPILHLRKSKITNFCTAYRNAGIIEILKYMRDEEFNDWKKLISAEHINMASKYIRRLAIALRVAFVTKYLQTLQLKEQIAMKDDLQNENANCMKWNDGFENFLEYGKSQNATFMLHTEMLNHSEEISALSFAERLGGTEGYSLMLAAVKMSLPFAFLNGSTSYAAYAVNLLHEHYKSGQFYQNVKAALFTTTHQKSQYNFGLDTQRELDHKDVLKSFRSGATMSSVVPRMALIDSLNEAHDASNSTKTFNETRDEISSAHKQNNLLGLSLTQTDINYILRIARLILRQNALSTDEDIKVVNVYSMPTNILPETMLDSATYEAGKYLITKYVASFELFGYQKCDIPDVVTIEGPKELLKKLKVTKGVTIRRTGTKQESLIKSERDVKESKRKKTVTRQNKIVDSLSSEMNACQAFMNSDCSKPKVQKSTGIQKALLDEIKNSLSMINKNSSENNADLNDFLLLGRTALPCSLFSTATHATVEFAGVKFKTRSVDGKLYLEYVEKSIINKILNMAPSLQRLVVCEEKYTFTPDEFKAATRSQRQKTQTYPISHLKTKEEILSATKFDKTTIITTTEGKRLISTYLASNAADLKFQRNILVDFDSELHLSQCNCISEECQCKRYTSPIQYNFSLLGESSIQTLEDIKQCKGEAEMAQVNWLLQYLPDLKPGKSCVSFLSSGDIDAITIHMFTLSYMWPRSVDGKYLHPVHIVLQKPGSVMDVYNITEILQILEQAWNDPYIGIKMSIFLSLGGNDFLPKFYGISHSTVLQTIMKNQNLRENLVKVQHNNNRIEVEFNSNLYVELMKILYCPKAYNYSELSFEEVRQITIKVPTIKDNNQNRNPKLWLPASSVLTRLSLNVICYIKYLMTAGTADTKLPDFLSDGCLTKSFSGEIEYDLGEEACVEDVNSVILVPSNVLLEKKLAKQTRKKKASKRKQNETPQKGRRKKVQNRTSTPKKI